MSNANNGLLLQSEDQTAMVSFRKSYPIDFNLHDDNHQNVLYIDDEPTDRSLHLELSNTSGRTVELLAPGSDTATADNHHFELRFRPGSLSGGTLGQIALAENDWQIGHKQQANGAVSLYILSVSQKARTLQPAEKIALILQGVRVAARGGSRGTRVELKYRQLQYSVDNTTITGHRIHHLDIISHRGKQHIPLHVGFVGSNTILNDGRSANDDLKLRITNVLKSDPADSKRSTIALKGKDDEAPSRFIVSFDVQAEGEQKEWALGTTSQVEAIEVKVAGSGGWDIEQNAEGESPEWILTAQSTELLAAGHHIQLTISNIISSLPSGYTNLYVRYENIPGYWDGQFVCPVEKAPIVYRGNKVGIGTTEPGAKLTIAGISSGDMGLQVVGGDSVGDSFIPWTDGSIILTGNISDNYPGRFIFRTYDHPKQKYAQKFVIDGKSKNVSIGTRDDPLKLTVDGGDTHLGGKLTVQDAVTIEKTLTVPGNVGIGTTDPSDVKLKVAGGDTHLGGKLTVQDAVTIEYPPTVPGNDNSSTFLLNIEGRGTAPVQNVLHVASNLITETAQDYAGLVRFGKDGDYQIIHKAGDQTSRPTLGIHVAKNRAFGVYSTGWEQLLTVEGGTGNTTVKGTVTAHAFEGDGSKIKIRWRSGTVSLGNLVSWLCEFHNANPCDLTHHMEDKTFPGRNNWVDKTLE